MIGGADGPMVLFTSLMLAKDLFVPITVVGYLYLGLTYGGYPYLIKLLIPKRLRGIPMPVENVRKITSAQKLVFAVVICTLLCLLFPVAAPLFLSLFVGVAVRESGLVNFQNLLSETFLYGATFFLGADPRRPLRGQHHARSGGAQAAAARHAWRCCSRPSAASSAATCSTSGTRASTTR